MKISDLLSKIFPASAFADNDLSAAFSASGLKDVEVPDETINKFNNYYLTRERAANDSDVAKELKAKHWGHFADTIEKDIKKIVATLPDEWKTKYYSIPETQQNGIYDRIAVLKEAVSHIAEKGLGEDVKTLSEKYRKAEKELREQAAAADDKVKKLTEEFASKEQGIKMNYALRSKLTGLLPKLDPNLLKTDVQKNFLIDSTITGLQSEYLLEFDKENPSTINFLKKDRTDVYEGNTKITLDHFLEKQLEPYTVKNNSNGTPAPSTPQAKPIPQNTGGKTLRDYQLEQATRSGQLV